MLPVLDTQAMREADRVTIEDLGVPSLVLMENAATGVVDAIRERFGDARQILILCGRGNNGGDGLAAARHLANGGMDVRCLVFSEPDRLAPDARTNLELAGNFGIRVRICPDAVETVLAEELDAGPDLVVDAMLGTGLDRPLEGRLARVVEQVRGRVPVTAVDVPTGLSASTGEVLGSVLEAELTVTFGALKTCHVLPPAAPLCGDVVVADIGIPPRLVEANARIWWVEAEDAALLLPMRPAAGHKGTFGHLLIVAGSPGRAGAASLAAGAAVASGAGLVTVAVPETIAGVVDGAVLESMTHALPSTEDGTLAGAAGLDELLDGRNAVVVGPGIGTGSGSRQAVEHLVDTVQCPLLLDADAINLLGGRPERLAERPGETVCTPHPGELARLLGTATQDVVRDVVGAARQAADRSGAVVVAKGYRTVVCDPDGLVWINPTGDAHLATGGSGDVLTGLIGGLLAQGLAPEHAALLATFIHGRAGEIGAATWPAAVPAARLAEFVAHAWVELADLRGEDP